MRKFNERENKDGKLYLGDKGYYFQISSTISTAIFNKDDKESYIGISCDFGNLYSEITHYFLGLAVISEELKQLVKNKFKTDDEKRFRKSHVATWVSIGKAIIIGLWEIFNRQTAIVKIEDSQYKQAIQQVDEMKNQLKTFESKIDSLKVQIRNNVQTKNSPL